MSDPKITLGEFGQKLRFNVKEDISSSTVTLVFAAPNTPEITKTVVDGITVPATNLEVLEGGISKTYLANQYAEYTIEDGLINKTGKWRVRIIAETITQKKISEYVTFSVVP